jgi:hypothetical protein
VRRATLTQPPIRLIDDNQVNPARQPRPERFAVVWDQNTVKVM